MPDPSDDHAQGDRPDRDRQRAHPVEMLVGSVGGLLVLALLVFFGYQAVTLEESGPRFETSVTGIEQQGGEYVVHFEVDNVGGATGESVQVVAEVTRGGKTVAQRTTTLAYVPPDSARSGGLVFTEDPRRGELTVSVGGYRLP